LTHLPPAQREVQETAIIESLEQQISDFFLHFPLTPGKNIKKWP